MKDNNGRKIIAIYPIAYDAAYCIYNISDDNESVYTTYTWCGKFAKRTRNKLLYDRYGNLYFRKDGKQFYLNDFMKID